MFFILYNFIVTGVGIKNASSNKYKLISKENNKEYLIKNTKDFLIIFIGLLTTFSFFKKPENPEKPLYKKVLKLESEVKSIHKELHYLQTNQKHLKNDSIIYGKKIYE